MPQPDPRPTSPLVLADPPGLSDHRPVERVRTGDAAAFELIIRRHNRLLFRLARGVLRNGTEAEDVVQGNLRASVREAR
jgi:RNA polymerase sigma-70 factor (ECF subfamily)